LVYNHPNPIEINLNGIGSPSELSNQLKQLHSFRLNSSQDVLTMTASVNNTQPSTLIENLSHRSIDRNETNFEFQGQIM